MRTSWAFSSVIGKVAIAQIAMADVTIGIAASHSRIRKIVRSVCDPPSATSKPVALRR